jgi:hypothetical protein
MKYFYIILFLLLNKLCFSQKNLVRNFSFEDSVNCGFFNGITNVALIPSPWYSPSKVSNLSWNINKCVTFGNQGVPLNTFDDTSYQYPKTGNGYVAFHSSVASSWNYNQRTYVQQQLRDSLITSKTYYAEFFVNLPNSMRSANNNVSMLLTKNAVYSDTINYSHGLRYIPANAQIVNYGNPIITDTLNWVKVSGIYKAQGGEKFITIGNFKDDANTQIIKFTPAGGTHQLVYFLDDVSVIPLDSMCLKADAGVDKSIALGDSTFIGSYTNGISNIMWLQNGNLKIDSTKPGFFVKPIASTFYVVQQTVNGCFSSDTVFVNVGTVASNLLILKGTINNNIVTCTWNNVKDDNVLSYSLKRKIDNNYYKTIYIENDYRYIHNNFSYQDTLSSIPTNSAINLEYLVEVLYKNGRKQLSNILEFNTSSNDFNRVKVFPNPAKTFVNVHGKNLKTVELIDINGRVLQTKNVLNNQGFTFYIGKLNNGILLMRITDNKNVVTTKKIIKN